MPTKKDFVEYFNSFDVPTDFFDGYVCEEILPDTEKFKIYKDKDVDVEVRKHLWWSETPLIMKMDFIKRMNKTFDISVDMLHRQVKELVDMNNKKKQSIDTLLDMIRDIGAEHKELRKELMPKIDKLLEDFMNN